MEEEIVTITFSIGQGNDFLKINLEDFVWSLDKNLRKTKEGKAQGEFKGGVFIVTVRGSSIGTVRSYVDAFAKAMKRDGCRFILKVRQADQEGGHAKGVSGTVKGETVNREKLRARSILLECSLKDAAKGEKACNMPQRICSKTLGTLADFHGIN